MSELDSRRQKLAVEHGLGGVLLSAQVGNCELTIHRQVSEVLSTSGPRGTPPGAFWIVQVCAYTKRRDNVSAFSRDLAGHFVRHESPAGTAIYGVLSGKQAVIEATVREDERVPVQMAMGAFLAVVPKVPEVVLTWRDSKGVMLKRWRLSTLGAGGDLDAVLQLMRHLDDAYSKYDLMMQ